MKVGDLVVKTKGMERGSSGIVLRIYNPTAEGSTILEVLSKGKIRRWAKSWCDLTEEK